MYGLLIQWIKTLYIYKGKIQSLKFHAQCIKLAIVRQLKEIQTTINFKIESETKYFYANCSKRARKGREVRMRI